MNDGPGSAAAPLRGKIRLLRHGRFPETEHGPAKTRLMNNPG